tara:strand:- start:93 stop:365 length:273 start_codon:yes stop_codon:yes gene_type:complete
MIGQFKDLEVPLPDKKIGGKSIIFEIRLVFMSYYRKPKYCSSRWFLKICKKYLLMLVEKLVLAGKLSKSKVLLLKLVWYLMTPYFFLSIF